MKTRKIEAKHSQPQSTSITTLVDDWSQHQSNRITYQRLERTPVQ